LFEYKQSPFIGYSRWIKTYFKYKTKENNDKKYITY